MDHAGSYRSVSLRTFHCFQRLPPEMRVMIWKYCIYSQDRVVEVETMGRHILRAQCPMLFLVCQESKYIAERAYRRLRNADITLQRAYPIFSRLRGPLVCFDADVFSINLPVTVDNIWGCRVATKKLNRIKYPNIPSVANARIGPTERAVNEFCSTPMIKRIIVEHTEPGAGDALQLVVMILQLSGDHHDNAAERYLSGLYKWLRDVDEVWVPWCIGGVHGARLLIRGEAVENVRRGKPRLGRIRDTHSGCLRNKP